MMTLTYKQLQSMHACSQALRRFRIAFGTDKIALTADAINIYMRVWPWASVGDIRWLAYELHSSRYAHDKAESDLWLALWECLMLLEGHPNALKHQINVTQAAVRAATARWYRNEDQP